MLYRRLELSLYGIVFVVSVGAAVVSERLDFRLQKQTLGAEVTDTNLSVAFKLEAALAQLVAWTNGMAAVVSLKPSLDQAEFSTAAARLGTDTSDVLNIALATDGVVRRVYPLNRNSVLLGTDLRSLPNQSEGVEAARRTAKPIFLGPLDLVQGGRGFIMRLAFSGTPPDEDPSDPREMISIVVDADGFFAEIARETASAGINTMVSRIEDGAVIFGNASVVEQQPVTTSLVTPSNTWQVASAPASGWPLLSSNAPTIAALALLRMVVVYLVLRTIFRLLRKQKAAEDQLVAAIEALDDGFALFDSDDRLALSNRRYHEIYRTSGDLLVRGATFEEILRGGVARGQYPAAVGQEEEWIAKRLAIHRLGESVIEQRLDDGTWLKVAERRTGDGGIVGFRVDITELKLATEAARAAERAKSDFISVLSHELRTPLTIVMGYVSLMATTGRLPEADALLRSLASGAIEDSKKHLDLLIRTTEDMASKAHRSALHLLSLINHLLDFSKLEAGKMQLDPADLEVENILADIEQSFREIIEAKGLYFNVAKISAHVSGDPIRVRQILTNLLSNALKFTESGAIRLEATLIGDSVLFQVHDTGCGISHETFDRIFGRFEQVDSSSTRRAGGTGLGLAISKSLVEMMGGEIGFESTSKSGSTFWFTLPVANKEG